MNEAVGRIKHFLKSAVAGWPSESWYFNDLESDINNSEKDNGNKNRTTIKTPLFYLKLPQNQADKSQRYQYFPSNLGPE